MSSAMAPESNPNQAITQVEVKPKEVCPRIEEAQAAACAPLKTPPQTPPRSSQGQGLFAFKEQKDIKQQVKDALKKKEPYSVFMYYKEDGIFPKIAKSSLFENCTLAVIAINAVYIAIDTDWNKEEPLTPTDTYSLTEAGAFFQFMEHAFCVYFTFEWICRFMSFKRKCDGLKDGWFIFDSLLVFMMVMETWVLLIIMAAMGQSGGSPLGGQTSILRLFRLLRLSRLMRMLRSLPELMILIKGMVTAMKSVMYVMGLLVLITYVFAIAFSQLSVEKDIGYSMFANVANAMYSLLLHLTFLDDMAGCTDALRDTDSHTPMERTMLLVLAFIFVALAALTVMNMLIGVLCDVVSAVAKDERDEIRTETLCDNMRKIVKTIDTNKDMKVSYKEFCDLLKIPEALSALEEVDVKPVGLVDFAELFFFEDGKEKKLEFDEFMEVVLDLRETNDATVKDMLNLWMKIKTNTNKEISTCWKMADNLQQKTESKLQSLDAQNGRMLSQLSATMAQLRSVTSKIPDSQVM